MTEYYIIYLAKGYLQKNNILNIVVKKIGARIRSDKLLAIKGY